MIFKALESVAGKVCFGAGELVELTDKAIIEDLVNAGYIEPVKAEGKSKDLPEAIAETSTEAEAKPAKRGRKAKANEG